MATFAFCCILYMGRYIYDFHCTFSDRMCYIAAGQLPWTAWIYLYSVNAHARIHNAFNLCIIMYNVTQNVWTKFYIIQLKQDSEQPLDKPQSTNHRERLSFLVSGRKYVEEASLSGWVASLRVLLRKSQTKDFLWNTRHFSSLLPKCLVFQINLWLVISAREPWVEESMLLGAFHSASLAAVSVEA